MMISVTCPGLPANWINGWLAAVGATVLDSRIRLHWTKGGSPVAVLSAELADPVGALAEAWPDRKSVEDLPIAEHWKNAASLERKVSVEAFVQRARAARSHSGSWALSSTLTDLHVDKNGEVAHAPFDPAGPGTIKWLHHRLIKVHDHVAPSVEHLGKALAGRTSRVKDHGLGFDITRLGSLGDSSGKWVNPVVEVLAFFGLAILPLRGKGADERTDPSSRTGAIQRGWLPHGRGFRFCWPAWSHWLDQFGIDALMDTWTPDNRSTWRQMGVHAGWRIQPYKARGTSDPTRAFASERL